MAIVTVPPRSFGAGETILGPFVVVANTRHFGVTLDISALTGGITADLIVEASHDGVVWDHVCSQLQFSRGHDKQGTPDPNMIFTADWGEATNPNDPGWQQTRFRIRLISSAPWSTSGGSMEIRPWQ